MVVSANSASAAHLDHLSRKTWKYEAMQWPIVYAYILILVRCQSVLSLCQTKPTVIFAFIVLSCPNLFAMSTLCARNCTVPIASARTRNVSAPKCCTCTVGVCTCQESMPYIKKVFASSGFFADLLGALSAGLPPSMTTHAIARCL